MALTTAAIYTLYTERLTGLFPMVGEILQAPVDPLVRETASWVAGRLSDPPFSSKERS